MRKFKKYYLVWFIIFGLMTITGLIGNREYMDTGLLIFAFCTGIIAPLLIGKLMDWTQNVWSPKRRKKFYNQVPLKNLSKLGFKNIDNEYFEGIYKRFQMRIWYDHSFQRILGYYIFYIPKTFDNDEFDRINSLFKESSLKFSLQCPGMICTTKDITFKIPKLENIESTLNKIIECLEEKDITPIDRKELEEKLETHYNTVYSK